jgi:formiminoglutamate deiminase
VTASPATFWCELAWLGPSHGSVSSGVALTLAGDRIASVEEGVEPSELPSDAVRLSGVTMPGLANAHSHAFHRALRGRTQAGTGSFWTWRDEMYRLASVLDPTSYEALARATFAEMALGGITCVGEFHYLHHGPGGQPYDDDAMSGAIVAAADEAGIRLTLVDTCYLHGGIGVAPNEMQLRFSDGSVDEWARRVSALPESAAVRVGAAIHSVRAVDPASMRTIAAWAAHRDAPLHAHVSEQPIENEQCLAAFGCSPVELLAGCGVISERFTAVHATHVNDHDIAVLGSASAGCCLCPTTERDLADGIGPSAALAGVGARLCLGSDSHAVIDLFEETRAVELDERLRSLRRGTHDARSLLSMATANGYSSLGWPDGGRLDVGALADFITVGLDSVRLADINGDEALSALVFVATGADVRHVVVGGDVVVRDHAHVSVDVAAELRSSIRALRA